MMLLKARLWIWAKLEDAIMGIKWRGWHERGANQPAMVKRVYSFIVRRRWALERKAAIRRGQSDD